MRAHPLLSIPFALCLLICQAPANASEEHATQNTHAESPQHADAHAAPTTQDQSGDAITAQGIEAKGIHQEFKAATGEAKTKTQEVIEPAAKMSDISTLPGHGAVIVSGKVTKIDDGTKFTVEDATGKIDVKGAKEVLAQVKEGLSVTVTGHVKKAMFGLSKIIQADNVVIVNATEDGSTEAETN